MKIKILKDFQTTVYGSMNEGAIVDVPDGLAQQYCEHGLAESYSTKVVYEVPMVPGAEKPATSSPVDPAQTEKTRPKRGRKAKSSQ